MQTWSGRSPLPPASFGALLKRYRFAAGLTQEQLAERAGTSVRTISDLERGVALRPQRDTLTILLDALALPARDRARLISAAGRPQRSPALPDSPSRPAPIGAPLLVGRDLELELIERHLAGELPPVLLLAGEPGIGKSRLLQEAAGLAPGAGYTVLAGGGQRRSGQEPYAPLLDTLSRSLQALPASRLRTALSGCGWLTRLLPELAELANVPFPTGTLPPEQERRLIFAAVGRYLANIAGPSGTLLLLDDLQWSSRDGLDLLASVIGTGESGAVRVIAAYRQSEVGRTHPLSALLAELAERRLAEQRTLSPLAETDALSLVESVLERAVDEPQVRQRIVERAGGVPFFLVSCVHALQAGDGGEGVPWTVAQSVRQRVAALSSAAQEVVHVAAILGRVVERSTLLGLVDAPEREVMAGLDAASGAHLLLPHNRATYRFAHDVVRESIEADLGQAERVYLHRKAAEVLERQQEAAGHAAVLAWHFREGDQPHRAIPHALRAGDQALAVFAHGESEEQYRIAVQLAQMVGDPRREAEALEKLGNLLWSTGCYDEALTMLEQASSLYERASDLDALGRVAAKIGWTHSHRGTPGEGIARLQSLATRFEGLEPTGGLLDIYDALFHLYLRQGMHGELAAAAQRASDVARTVGDESLLVRGELNRGLALYWQDRHEDALRVLIETIPRAEATSDAVTLCRTLMWTVNSCLEVGYFVRAMPYAERTVEVTERIGSPTFLIAALVNRADLLIQLGEWTEARACAERALAVASAALSWAGDAHLTLAELAILQGRWDEALVHFEKGGAVADSTGHGAAGPHFRMLLAQKDLLEGQPARARDRLDPVVQTFHVAGPGRQVLAEASLESGDQDLAASLVTQGLEHARARGLRFPLVGWLRLTGVLTVKRARWDEARAAFDEGLSLAKEMPYPYGAARILYELGRLHAAQGRQREARTSFEEALAIFRRLGAQPYIDRTEQARAQIS